MKILVAFVFILLISNAVGNVRIQHYYVNGLKPAGRVAQPGAVVADANDNKVIRRFLIFSN